MHPFSPFKWLYETELERANEHYSLTECCIYVEFYIFEKINL